MLPNPTLDDISWAPALLLRKAFPHVFIHSCIHPSGHPFIHVCIHLLSLTHIHSKQVMRPQGLTKQIQLLCVF